VAKYKKKRARQLQHDKFRDTTMRYVGTAAHRLEGKGRTILYGIAALVVIGLVVWGIMTWRGSRDAEARFALGRAIKITQTPVVATPVPGSTEPSFRTEKERAQKAVEEFQKVAANYGGDTRLIALYFIAVNHLTSDRSLGLKELEILAEGNEFGAEIPNNQSPNTRNLQVIQGSKRNKDVIAQAKFALAQAKEGDGKYEEAAALYSALVKEDNTIVTPETANLRLALVYEKLGKTQEAADILFKMVEAARQAKSKDGKPARQSGAARMAEAELEKIDPDRHAQLPAPPLPPNLAM
jgi:hypothetical protein